MNLTDRQAEILPLIAEGLTNGEIGQRLFLSPATVQTHVAEMLERAGARNRTQLVTVAFRKGLIK